MRQSNKSGWEGQDSMRAKAERALGHEFSQHLVSPDRMSASATGREKIRPYKKGGHVKHHKPLMPKYQTDMHIPKRAKAPSLNVETLAEAGRMRRGGHVRKHAAQRHAAGGTVYEQEMRGMRPGMDKKINYEKDMRGMKYNCEPKPSAYTKSHMKSGGKVGSYVKRCMSEGGSAKMSKGGCFNEGGAAKMAMGGSGKIRLHEMNKSGKPLKAK